MHKQKKKLKSSLKSNNSQKNNKASKDKEIKFEKEGDAESLQNIKQKLNERRNTGEEADTVAEQLLKEEQKTHVALPIDPNPLSKKFKSSNPSNYKQKDKSTKLSLPTHPDQIRLYKLKKQIAPLRHNHPKIHKFLTKILNEGLISALLPECGLKTKKRVAKFFIFMIWLSLMLFWFSKSHPRRFNRMQQVLFGNMAIGISSHRVSSSFDDYFDFNKDGSSVKSSSEDAERLFSSTNLKIPGFNAPEAPRYQREQEQTLKLHHFHQDDPVENLLAQNIAIQAMVLENQESRLGVKKQDPNDLSEQFSQVLPRMSITTKTGGLSRRVKYQAEEDPHAVLPKRFSASDPNYHRRLETFWDRSVLISPELDDCKAKQASGILLIIKSRPTSFNQRKAIRETYGSLVTLMFLIGMPRKETFDNQNNRNLVDDHELYQKIINEGDQTFDLLVQNYTDGYSTLIEKTFSGIKWAHQNCKNIPFIIIGDDDVYISTKKLAQIIKLAHMSEHHQGFSTMSNIECLGKYIINAKATRQGKWGVDYSIWPGDSYKFGYCEGACYMIRRETLSQIYVSSLSTNMEFPIDQTW